MKLHEIQGTYNVAVSLGGAYQAAEQLKRHNLRTFSGPVDWFTLYSVPGLISLLQTRFKNFMQKKNIEIQGEHDGNLLVFDKKFGVLSVHDFPIESNLAVPTWLDKCLKRQPKKKYELHTYPEFIEKIQRRVNNFYNKIEKNKVFFLRVSGTYEEMRMLQDCIRGLGVSDFTILVVNHSEKHEIVDLEWDLEHVCGVEIYHPKDMIWSGYDPHYDVLLKGITIQDTTEEV